jgi:hypothetical protein
MRTAILAAAAMVLLVAYPVQAQTDAERAADQKIMAQCETHAAPVRNIERAVAIYGITARRAATALCFVKNSPSSSSWSEDLQTSATAHILCKEAVPEEFRGAPDNLLATLRKQCEADFILAVRHP